MITYTTSNSEKLTQLYKKANERLQALKVNTEGKEIKDSSTNFLEVDTIQEYFAHLRHIIWGPEDNELDWGVTRYGADNVTEYTLENGMIFLRMPVGDDEPPIFIDANTRTISRKINGNGAEHPFFKNGISVQGDEVAEIVFFKINRYFDAMDLSETRIIFQWAPASEPDQIRATPAFITDIEDEPGMLIFGWPIGSDITQFPGAITFSVRFYLNDTEGKITYSFNTKDQTVNINSALVLDQVTYEDSVDDNQVFLIVNRVMNSSYGGVDNPAIPVYVLFNPEQDYNFGDINEEIVLFGAGAKTGQGKLAYQWVRTLFGDSTPLNENNVKYAKVNNYIPGIINYYYQTEGSSSYKYAGDIIDSELKYENFIDNHYPVTMYVQYEILEPFTIPDYYIAIDNYINSDIPITYYYLATADANDYSIASIKNAEDFEKYKNDYSHVYIHGSAFILNKDNVRPGNIYLDIKNQINAKEITIFNSLRNGFVEDINQYYTIEGPKKPLIETDLLDRSITNDTLSVKLNNIEEDVEYLWQQRMNQNSDDYNIVSSDSSSYTPNQEGFYCLKVINKKNNGRYINQSNECFVYTPYEQDAVRGKISLVNSDMDSKEYIIKIELDPRDSYFDSYYCSSMTLTSYSGDSDWIESNDNLIENLTKIEDNVIEFKIKVKNGYSLQEFEGSQSAGLSAFIANILLYKEPTMTDVTPIKTESVGFTLFMNVIKQ